MLTLDFLFFSTRGISRIEPNLTDAGRHAINSFRPTYVLLIAYWSGIGDVFLRISPYERCSPISPVSFLHYNPPPFALPPSHHITSKKDIRNPPRKKTNIPKPSTSPISCKPRQSHLKEKTPYTTKTPISSFPQKRPRGQWSQRSLSALSTQNSIASKSKP